MAAVKSDEGIEIRELTFDWLIPNFMDKIKHASTATFFDGPRIVIQRNTIGLCLFVDCAERPEEYYILFVNHSLQEFRLSSCAICLIGSKDVIVTLGKKENVELQMGTKYLCDPVAHFTKSNLKKNMLTNGQLRIRGHFKFEGKELTSSCSYDVSQRILSTELEKEWNTGLFSDGILVNNFKLQSSVVM